MTQPLEPPKKGTMLEVSTPDGRAFSKDRWNKIVRSLEDEGLEVKVKRVIFK